MAKFDAGKVVEALEYTFRTFKDSAGKPYLDKEGTVREPSDQQIGEYLEGIKEIPKDPMLAGLMEHLGDDPAPEDVLEALEDITGEMYVGLQAKVAGLHAALCSNDPSQDELMRVPLRARNLFYAWMIAEVVRPEAVTPGGTAEVVNLHTAARG